MRASSQDVAFIEDQVVESLLDKGECVRGGRVGASFGQFQDIRSEVVIDTSGSVAFLRSNAGLTSPKERGNYINAGGNLLLCGGC